MNAATAQPTQELENAFRLFAETSRQMEAAYRELEGRVAQLNRELAVARSERFRQLREKERLAHRLERLLAALPAGVLELDGSGVVVTANPAARELLGEPLAGQAWVDIRARALAVGGGEGQTFTALNGRTVTLSARRGDGTPGQVVLLHDVTETHELRRLVERQRGLAAMGEMAAQLAHQIRTPLASALLYLSHLERRDLGAERRDRTLDKTRRCLQELERQVNDMLLYARTGRFESEQVDFARLAEDLRRTLEPQLGDCRLRIDGFSGGIEGGHEALAGALGNLARNAMEAGAGCIEMDCAIIDDGVTLVVADDGPGIDPAARERIFEPFYTTRPGGTGLGLAVVRTVVEAHGGMVDVATSATGGARFTLTLPRPPKDRILPSGSALSPCDDPPLQTLARRNS